MLNQPFFIVFTCVFLLLSPVIGFGQDVAAFGELEDSSSIENNLLVEAQVLLNSKPMLGVTVLVYNGDNQITTTTTADNGFFSLKLNFDSVYVLHLVHKGYVTKKVEIDTRELPEEDKQFGYDLGLFKVEMLEIQSGESYSLYDEPIARFRYSDVAQLFVVDKKFKKQVKQRFEKENKEPEVIRF
jgi:hypothetical protein